MGKHKHRHRVRIVLSDLEDPEFSLGALLGRSNSTGEDARKKKKKKKNKPSPFPDDDDISNDPWSGGNILTQLEQKYCGHARMRSPTGEEEGGREGGKRKRARKDDMYELDDGFVDDSELYEVFEKQHEAQSILTKYSGFFVNKGELELVGHKEDGQEGRGKEKKKRGRKSAGEGEGMGGGGGGKKPKSGGGGGGEDDENGGWGGGDEGGNGGKVKKAKKQQQQQQQQQSKAGGGGEGGDDMSVVSNSSSTMASGGGGGSVEGSSTSSISSNKAKGAEMQAAALSTFRESVMKWQKEQQQSSSQPTAAAAAAALDELPLPLRPAALALDLVMRRPAGEKKYKSTHPGENGLSSQYIDMLQALLPLGGGREGGRAWRKGLAEAAVGRVRVLKGLIDESLLEFRRHYDVKKEKIAKRASSSSSSCSSSKEGGGEEGREGGGDGAMPPPKSMVLDMKLKQCMFTLLTSVKERCRIQVLFAGQGRGGGAEGGEAEGLLPLVPAKNEEEERKALTTLAEMWPDEGMKISRLRRAFNDYKGKQQLLQGVNGSAAAAGAAAASSRGKGGGVSVLKTVVPKADVEGGMSAPVPAKLKKKTSSTTSTTTTIKKKVVVAKKRTGPWKGSFKGLQRIPFNAADFEQEARIE